MAFSMNSMQASLPSIVSCRRQRPMNLINSRRVTIHTSVSPPCGLQSCPTNGAIVFAMRHRKRIPKLNRPADQRKALLRSLTTEVLRHGRITTTKTKAKAARKWVDKMVQLGKEGSLHSRRQALAWVYDKNVVASLFSKAPSRYGDRKGGYCRVITEERVRRGDSAEMAVIELV